MQQSENTIVNQVRAEYSQSNGSFWHLTHSSQRSVGARFQLNPTEEAEEDSAMSTQNVQLISNDNYSACSSPRPQKKRNPKTKKGTGLLYLSNATASNDHQVAACEPEPNN